MKIDFDTLVHGLLKEQPITAPMPVKTPNPTRRSTPNPTKRQEPAPNPSPFRRHHPGQMPDIRPKAETTDRGASAELSQDLLNIIQKHAKFIEG